MEARELEEWIAAVRMIILQDEPSNRDVNRFKEVWGDPCQEQEGGNSWNRGKS